jgi:hypothetical protein
VGRIPVITTRPPCAAAVRRTTASASASSPPKALNGRPASAAGVRLSSRLKRSISRTSRGSAASARTVWLRGRARPTVDQEQLELGTDGGRADAEARALQEPAQGQQALLEPYSKRW